jgi:hypothetical protein
MIARWAAVEPPAQAFSQLTTGLAQQAGPVERHLSADRLLAGQQSFGRVREEHHVDLVRAAAGVRERTGHRVRGEHPQAPVGELAERRHVRPGDEDVSIAAGLVDRSLAIGPIPFPQRALVVLAHRGQRDLVDDVDGLRRHHAALALLHEGDQIVRDSRCCRPRRRRPPSRPRPISRRDADDAHGRDGRMRAQRLLDLAG